MRVLQLVDSFAAGGAERMAVRFANALADRVDLSVVGTTRGGGPLESDVEAGVGRLRVSRHRTADLASAAALRSFLRSERIDVVHAHGTSVFLAAASMCGLRSRPALVWHDHNPNPWSRPMAATIGVRSRIDAVFTVSREITVYHLSLGERSERITQLPNFARPHDAEPARTAPIDLPGCRGNRIVCVAGIRVQKDHGTLLRAFQLVRRRHPEAHLLLVGAPESHELADRLEAQCRELGLTDSVHSLGLRSDVPAILQQCDIGVLSSTSEGFPVALLEYGGARLAVVSTAVGECPDILDHGRCGRLVPPSSPEALAEELSDLLEAEGQRSMLASRLHDRIEEHYSEDRVVTTVLARYRHVQETTRRPAGIDEA